MTDTCTYWRRAITSRLSEIARFLEWAVGTTALMGIPLIYLPWLLWGGVGLAVGCWTVGFIFGGWIWEKQSRP